MMKSFQNLWAKAGIEHLLSDPNRLTLTLFLFFLPTQAGKHFWPAFSYVFGIRVDYLSPTIYLTDLLIIVLIILSIKNIRTIFKKVRISKLNQLVILVTSLSLFLSIIISQNPILGVLKLTKIIEFFLLGLVLYINRDNLLKLMPKIFSITIIFESLLAFAQFLNKGSINGIFYFFGERMFNSQTPNIANAQISGELILRPYGTFPHPNVLAGFLLIGLTFLLFSTSFAKSNLLKITQVVGAFALLLTMSRISIILLFFVLIFFLVKKYLSKNKIRYGSLFLIFLIITVLTSSISNRFSFDLSSSSFKERQILINSSTEMIKEYPLFGVGLNNFLTSLPDYYKTVENVFYIQPVHNIPLLIFSEIGIFAGALVLYLFLLIFMRANFESRILLLLLFLISLFDHYFFTIQQGQLLLTLVFVISFIRVPSEIRRISRGRAGG